MTLWIGLFRGLNVGGNNRIKMDALKAAMSVAECTDIATYIQSGNVVFRCTGARAAIVKRIEQALAKDCGIHTTVTLLKATELNVAAKQNPFTDGESEPKTLHLFFLSKAPAVDVMKKLDDLRISSEQYAVHKRTLYLHAPDGIGRSKLAAYTTRMPGIDVTARNWRTMTKLLEMADDA